MKKILTLFISLILIGCSSSSKYDYWDISKFKMVPDALAEESDIKVIYSYRGPTGGKKKDWYNHVMVISVKTGDTINILTMVYPKDDYDKNKVYQYIGPNTIITKMSGMEPDEIAKVKDWDAVKLETRPFVCRDKKFDRLADNNFPTVIGSIGTVTKTDTSKVNPKINQTTQ